MKKEKVQFPELNRIELIINKESSFFSLSLSRGQRYDPALFIRSTFHETRQLGGPPYIGRAL